MNENKSKLSLAQEITNAITHGVGAMLAVAGLTLLVVFATIYGNIWHVVSFSIYGTTLVLLYLASTLYHSFTNPKVKSVFKILDHSAIYLLIAGTYTPFTLVSLRGVLGWSIFVVIWTLALGGIVFKALFIKKFAVLSTIFYVLMGWIIVFALKPLVAALPVGGVVWLVVGGLCYTGGAVFYGWKKLLFNHAIWHLFVLAGSICHFFSIFFYVLE